MRETPPRRQDRLEEQQALKPEPRDVERARAVITDFEAYLSGWPEFARYSLFKHERDKLVSLIASAIEAEREDQRERGAKVCDQHAANQARHGEHALAEQSRQDAAAIRSGGSRPQPEEEG